MEFTIDQVREMLCGSGITSKNQGTSLQIGKSYCLRSVTMYYLGRVVAITDTDVVLAEASWIPDTGRFYDFLKKGVPNECEPFVGNAVVFRGGLIDAVEWNHKLPQDQK